MITITLPLPSDALSPNARKHWSRKVGPTKLARELAKLESLNAMNRMGLIASPRWKHAATQIRAWFPTSRNRDADNLLASCKAVFDGMADAGIVINDSGFVHNSPQMAVSKDDPRMEIDVWEIDPE